MAPKTIKAYLSDMLEDLTDDDFDRFCHQLLDRKRPRVLRSKVEGKRQREIADVLVSTFTEAKSVGVAVGILKQIGCRDEAKKLAPIAPRGGVKKSGGPTSPVGSLKKSRGPSTLGGGLEKSVGPTAPRGSLKKSRGPSTLGGGLEKSVGPTAPGRSLEKSGACGGVKKPEEVEAEAKNRVLSEGGDLSDDRLVLSRYTIQLGKYKGQTFNWLMENDMGYVARLVNKHQNNRKNSKSPTSPLMANKDSLTEFVASCPDLMKKHKLLAKKETLQPGQKRNACSPATSFGPSAAKKRKAPLPAPAHIPTTSFGPSADQKPCGGLEKSGGPTAPCGGLEKSGAPTAPGGHLENSGAPTPPSGGLEKSGAPTPPSGGLDKSRGPTAPHGSLKKSGEQTGPGGGLEMSGAPTAPGEHLENSGAPTPPSGGLEKSRGPTASRGSLKNSGGPTAPGGGVKRSGARGGVKKPEEVKAEARNRVVSEGGDPSNDRLVLSRYTIQLGKHKGQTFNWLMENDMGYVARLVNKHQNNRKNSKSPVSPFMANKDSLTEFVASCPDLMKKHKLLAKKETLQPGQKRNACNPSTSFGPSAAKKRKAPLPAPAHIPTTSFGPSADQKPCGGLEKSGGPTAPCEGLEKSGAPTGPCGGLEKSGAPTAPGGHLENSGAPTPPSGVLDKSRGPTASRGGLEMSGEQTGPGRGLDKSRGPTAPHGSLNKSGEQTGPGGGLEMSGAPTAPGEHLENSGAPTPPSGGLEKSRGPTASRGSLKNSGGPTAPGGGVKRSGARGGVKKPEEVEAEARNRVVSEGGDPSNDRLVLSRYTIQLGKHKGQTFNWLMENDMGYVARLVNKHQNNRKNSKSPVSPFMANKDSLTEFVTSCPDLMKKVELLTKKDAFQPGQKRKACSPATSFGPSADQKL